MSQPHFPFVLDYLLLGCVQSVFDAVAEAPHDCEVEFLFAHLVFDSRVDAWIVVHFDDFGASVHVLEIDAVEAVPDEVRDAQRRFHDAVRNTFDGEAVEHAADFFLVRAFPVVDLPVVFCHVVLAGVNGAAVENADSPVEFRGRVFLGDEQVAVLEHGVENLFEFLFVVRLFDAEAEAGIRRLDDHRESEFLGERIAVFAVDDDCFWGRNFTDGHQFLQINFVRTAQNAVGVVDDGDAFALGAARERVGVVVDVRRFADEYGVEFAYAVVVLFGDEFYAESGFLGGLDEVADGLLVAWRFLFVGVYEYAEVVKVIVTLGGYEAVLFEVFNGELVHQILVRFRDFIDADGADALDEPFLLEYELGAKQRGLEDAVEFLGKFQVLGAHVLTEVDGQHEFRACQLVEALLDKLVNVVADDFHDGRCLEVADVLYVRNHLVAASFGQQAHVVALALVTVVAAKVKDADVFLRGVFVVGKVVFGRDDFCFGDVKLPVLRIVHDDDFFHNCARVVRRSCRWPRVLRPLGKSDIKL